MSSIAEQTDSARRDCVDATISEQRFYPPYRLHTLRVRNLNPYRFTQCFHLVGLFPREMGTSKMSVGG